jgi:hypothetical protein
MKALNHFLFPLNFGSKYEEKLVLTLNPSWRSPLVEIIVIPKIGSLCEKVDQIESQPQNECR